VLSLATSAARADDIFQQRDELRQQYSAQLEALAASCDQEELLSEAARIRAWAQSRDPYTLYLVALPDASLRRGADEEAPPAEAASDPNWQARFKTLREAQAEALFELARRAIRGQQGSLAYELVLAALRENPDHEEGRQLMGYQRHDGKWRTAYEIRLLRQGHVWHSRFGWIPEDHVARYDQGERFVMGRWMSRAEAQEFHGTMQRPWRVETEHFRISTNHSLEAGVDLGRRLEKLYDAWQQVFVRYYSSERQIQELFEGRAKRRKRARRHQVVYFRERDEYLTHVGSLIQGDLSITTGIYLGDHRTAYFFANGEEDFSTFYHEATHQLFSESRAVVPRSGARANFWIIEGIACYMESFSEHDGYYTIGGNDAIRFEDARYRLLQDDFYVPLAQMTGAGMEQIQKNPRIAMLYSQSAGLTYFLMHHEGGRHRDALMAYLVAVYTGRDRPSTLAELLGVPYHELDRQYRTFLRDSIPTTTASARDE
jgi:hypothetical protein